MNILDNIQTELTSLKEQNAQIMAKLESITKPSTDDDLMTVEQVCEFFGGIHITTVYDWAKKGKLQMYGIAGSRFFKRGEVKASLVKMNNLKKVA